jgi:hypothetical protein
MSHEMLGNHGEGIYTPHTTAGFNALQIRLAQIIFPNLDVSAALHAWVTEGYAQAARQWEEQGAPDVLTEGELARAATLIQTIKDSSTETVH